jgi:hypothetical protein
MPSIWYDPLLVPHIRLKTSCIWVVCSLLLFGVQLVPYAGQGLICVPLSAMLCGSTGGVGR